MKRIALSVVFMLCVVVGLAHAEDRGTSAEAKAMLDKAIVFYKANGSEKSFAAFNDPKGQFVYKDLYIFAVNMDGKVVAHGTKPGLIGKSLREIRDADEKNFIAEMLTVARTKGSGTVDYKWENPLTLIVERKTSYIEKIDGMVLGCGYFKAYDWQRSAEPFTSPQWWK